MAPDRNMRVWLFALAIMFASSDADAQIPLSQQTPYQRATTEWLACVDKQVPLAAREPYPDKLAAAYALVSCVPERRKVITELIKEMSQVEKRAVSEDEAKGVMDLLDSVAIEKATKDVAEVRSKTRR
jgi:hypothetical protein